MWPLQVWGAAFFLICISLRITGYKLQQESDFHQLDSFTLRWHIPLSGCHGNFSPFVEGGCSRSGIFSYPSVCYQLQWIISTSIKLWILSSRDK